MNVDWISTSFCIFCLPSMAIHNTRLQVHILTMNAKNLTTQIYICIYQPFARHFLLSLRCKNLSKKIMLAITSNQKHLSFSSQREMVIFILGFRILVIVLLLISRTSQNKILFFQISSYKNLDLLLLFT